MTVAQELNHSFAGLFAHDGPSYKLVDEETMRAKFGALKLANEASDDEEFTGDNDIMLHCDNYISLFGIAGTCLFVTTYDTNYSN